jgi:hypothetical protein
MICYVLIPLAVDGLVAYVAGLYVAWVLISEARR